MSSLGKKEELFKDIESYLVTMGFDQTDAKIYVLALNRGTLSSSDVSEEFPEIRQNTAVERLKKLVKKGCLEFNSEETKSKHPSAMNFKAVHPKVALREVLEKTKELPKLLELYEEHWDHLAEKPGQDSETWLSKSEVVGIRIGASVLSGATEEVKIYSHDCSWCRYNDVQTDP